MHGAENEIQFVPMFLHPFATGRRIHRIVVELNSSANFQVDMLFAQLVDLIEIDSSAITIVIGKSDIAQSAFPRAIDPRLQQFCRIRLHPVSLRMGVIICEKTRAHCAVMNFCRARRSGYFGWNTSAIYTLFGASSRVAIVSLYSMV